MAEESLLVSACQDILASTARMILTSVLATPVEIMGSVLTVLMPTTAHVLMGLGEQTAKSTLMTVHPTLVTTEEFVTMIEAPLPAIAPRGSRAQDARGISMTALETIASTGSVLTVSMTSPVGATQVMLVASVTERSMSAR